MLAPGSLESPVRDEGQVRLDVGGDGPDIFARQGIPVGRHVSAERGAALGGGIYPVSAIAADRHVLEVVTPGSHGSTFGGNPLAAAIGHEVVTMLEEGEFQRRAAHLGLVLEERLRPLVGRGLDAIRVRGLWAGLDVEPGGPSGREVCEQLMARGILAKDTHGSTIRLAPPLVVTEDEVAMLVDAVAEVVG